MTNRYIDFIGEPIMKNIIKIYPRTEKNKPLYVAYETDCVGVYGKLTDAAETVNKLATISHLEWDEHDRAGENGSCSLCDGTHMITQTLTPWRTTLTEVFEEQFKAQEIGDLPIYTSAHLIEL